MICVKCGKDAPDGAFCIHCGAKQAQKARARRRRGNGSGTAFKRGNPGSWYVQVTTAIYLEDGKLVQRRKTKGGFPTKSAALAYAEQLKVHEEKHVPTLRELYDVWHKTEHPKLSKSKQQAYDIARRRLDPIIDRQVDQLTTTDLQTCVNESSTSFYTARDMKVLLSHCYKRACADQFVTANLAQWIVLPQLNEKEAEPFTRDEVAVMWSAYADGNLFVGQLLLMIYSGMMPAELFACRASQIDEAKCEIYGCGKKTKVRKEAVIVYAECVKPIVRQLIEDAVDDKIQPLSKNAWYDKYHETMAAIGVRDLPPYSCRHTTGTEAANSGMNSATIQRILRHAKITTSQRYIHQGTDEVHKGINQIAAMPQ